MYIEETIVQEPIQADCIQSCRWTFPILGAAKGLGSLLPRGGLRQLWTSARGALTSILACFMLLFGRCPGFSFSFQVRQWSKLFCQKLSGEKYVLRDGEFIQFYFFPAHCWRKKSCQIVHTHTHKIWRYSATAAYLFFLCFPWSSCRLLLANESAIWEPCNILKGPESPFGSLWFFWVQGKFYILVGSKQD